MAGAQTRDNTVKHGSTHDKHSGCPGRDTLAVQSGGTTPSRPTRPQERVNSRAQTGRMDAQERSRHDRRHGRGTPAVLCWPRGRRDTPSTRGRLQLEARTRGPVEQSAAGTRVRACLEAPARRARSAPVAPCADDGAAVFTCVFRIGSVPTHAAARNAFGTPSGRLATRLVGVDRQRETPGAGFRSRSSPTEKRGSGERSGSVWFDLGTDVPTTRELR